MELQGLSLIDCDIGDEIPWDGLKPFSNKVNTNTKYEKLNFSSENTLQLNKLSNINRDKYMATNTNFYDKH